MPRRPNHAQSRADTWKRVKRSFDYLWSAAVQLWKPFELDRLDILCSWSYLALQFADAADEDTIELIECKKLVLLRRKIVSNSATSKNAVEKFKIIIDCHQMWKSKETNAKSQAAHVLATTIVVENAHQANQRVATVERNIKETKSLAEKLGKKVREFGVKDEAMTISQTPKEPQEEEEEGVPAKRRKEEEE
ncbi:unnamed protein product [Strongylus vulgaris]|uniref:Uncharacterized protein n=1 Tax=Strongylus vulgaris TaxID=40348 RepID=A0A3P7LIL0_STRVU|nr:unnamed protein product [Strongylus vulgaris]